MSGVNKVILIGNLGSDPERKQTTNSSVTTFSVATSERWTDKAGDTHERTEWHKCVAWARTGEIAAEYLRKGSKVYVEGSLQTRSWQTDSGETRYMTEINVRNMQMLDSRRESYDNDGPPANPTDDQDLPF